MYVNDDEEAPNSVLCVNETKSSIEIDKSSMFAAPDGLPPNSSGSEKNETDLGKWDCIRLAPHGVGKARYIQTLWREGSGILSQPDVHVQ